MVQRPITKLNKGPLHVGNTVQDAGWLHSRSGLTKKSKWKKVCANRGQTHNFLVALAPYEFNLLTPIGQIRPREFTYDCTWFRRRHVSAGLHATDALRHVCIDYFTYSDDHRSRQSGLCPSRERLRSSKQGYKWTYRSFPAVLKWFWEIQG